MKNYKVTILPKYSITGEKQTLETDDVEKVKTFMLENGYDIEDKEIEHLINEGGQYKGIEDTEFGIEILEKENEIKETSFNNAELFSKEFNDYIVGKKIIDFSEQNKKKQIKTITHLAINEKENIIFVFCGKEKFELTANNFQNFIDGEPIGSVTQESFQLILQEKENEIEKEKENKKNENQNYFIVNMTTMKILSGYEYKEDAKQKLENLIKYGTEGVLSIQPKRELSKLNLNPENENNWSFDEHDFSIIEKCINAGVERGDYSEKEANHYVNEFKQNGKFIPVIKAQLIYCLGEAQQKLRSAFIVSNTERISEKCDENCRIQKELKRIIAMEK